MMFFEVIAYASQVGSGSWRPADTHLGAQHLFESSVHFFFFNKLATIGLSDTFFNGGAKLCVIFNQTQRGVFHQRLRGGPHSASDFRKLGFLLGREVYFHRHQSTEETLWLQGAG